MSRFTISTLILVVCGIMVVIASGCATLADARMARGTGETSTYDVPAEDIWRAMPDVLSAVGLDYVGDNRTEGYVLAQRAMTALSYGENVAIFIESVATGRTKIEIVSKKAVATNIFAPDWSRPIFQELDKRFGS